MGAEIIPDVSTAVAAVCEWTACLLYWAYASGRFSRWVSILLMGILLAAQIFLHTNIFDWLPMYLFGIESGVGLMLTRAAGILSNVLLMFAGTVILTRLQISVAVYVAVKAFVAAELIASAACVLYDVSFMAGLGASWYAEVFFYGGACVLYLLIMHSSVQEETDYLQRCRISVNQILTACLIAVSTFCVSNSSLIIAGIQNEVTNESMMSRVVLRLVGDLCGFLILWLLAGMNLENETREELTAVKNTLNQQYQQYLAFRDTSEYISRQSHDLKHQIQALRMSASEEEREAYIQEMERMIALNDAWNVTGNSALDSILTQKKMYCIGHDIEFSCRAKAGELEQFAVRDICSLFGNIIDNAIEHVSGFAEKDKRVIRGTVERKRSILVIEFENYYEGPEITGDELPPTSKRDKTQHGYGLKNIRYVAEKYGGTMTIRTDADWFIICVMLPVTDRSIS